MAGVSPAGTLEEQRAVREGAGLLDRSGRGKLALTGAQAVEFLNGQVTNELADLRVGEGCYAAFLTHKGKMLGDLRVLAAVAADDGSAGPADGAVPSELLLDTERVSLQDLFDMIRRFKVGYDVELHKRTLERALLSLIGPSAAQVAGVAGELPAQEHTHIPFVLGGVPARAIRTDVGVDVLLAAEGRERALQALLEQGAEPISEAAAECVRVEHGRPRFGVDIDATTIPQEAGLNERAVSFTKGCYVGQETVARLYYRGKPNRHLRGLRLTRPARHGEELRLGERVVGAIGSAAESPTLGPIAIALMRREAEPGSTVTVGEDSSAAEVLALPFPPA